MQLYIIMITLNNLKYTRQTVESFKTKHPYKFIIIDNVSRDGTQQYLDQLARSPNFIIIKKTRRVSVAAAWNEGLRICLADPEFKFVFIINNDLKFDSDCLDALIRFVEAHPEYVAVSPINLLYRKTVAGIFDNDRLNFFAALLTRSCVQKIGFFDEGFVGAYFEDNDYHTRIYRAGLKSAVVFEAGCYHYTSRTINEGFTPAEVWMHHRNFEHNKEYFKKKWGFVPA